MNRLKTLFISSYVPVIGVITLISLWQLVRIGMLTSWLGALLATLPVLIFIVWVSVFKTARTRPILPVLFTIVTTGFAWSAYQVLIKGESEPFALGMAFVGWLGFILFDFWFSRYGRTLNERLAVGHKLPDFQVQDVDGKNVSSRDLLGRPALYMFYRGNWCPFCSAQVKELTQNYRDLIDRGMAVALISPQPHDLTRRVAQLYDVPFRFWVDYKCRAARTLDILHPEGVPHGSRKTVGGSDTVLPTVIIVDADGTILFTDQTDSYRIRPEPQVFLRVLTENDIT